ncbi:MAG TPA: hypothetical protein VIR02_00660, partial [Anaerolineales bacterium]
MAKRAKASEASEPEREVGIVKVDEPATLDDPPAEVQTKPETLPPPVETRAQLPPPRPPAPPHAVTSPPSGPGFGQRVG